MPKIEKYYIYVLSCVLLVMTSEFAPACDFNMGYRTTARLPNIEAAPNNVGLYFDLYSQAAKMIGCKLVVIREPKNRILNGMRKGNIDFYPGLTYRDSRAEYIFFYENGLPSLDVGLSRVELHEINNYHDLKNKIVLVPLGGAAVDADMYGFLVRSPPEMSFKKAINIILKGKADFYEDDIGTLNYYLKSHPLKFELKYHLKCCGGTKQLTLGFSRASTHYREELNPDYEPAKAKSPYNLPVRLTPNSKAHSFYHALKKLKVEGFTYDLYESYYGIHPDKIFELNK